VRVLVFRPPDAKPVRFSLNFEHGDEMHVQELLENLIRILLGPRREAENPLAGPPLEYAVPVGNTPQSYPGSERRIRETVGILVFPEERGD
jgi:hypothetical protein